MRPETTLLRPSRGTETQSKARLRHKETQDAWHPEALPTHNTPMLLLAPVVGQVLAANIPLDRLLKEKHH
jgi:hypothetical protein